MGIERRGEAGDRIKITCCLLLKCTSQQTFLNSRCRAVRNVRSSVLLSEARFVVVWLHCEGFMSECSWYSRLRAACQTWSGRHETPGLSGHKPTRQDDNGRQTHFSKLSFFLSSRAVVTNIIKGTEKQMKQRASFCLASRVRC